MPVPLPDFLDRLALCPAAGGKMDLAAYPCPASTRIFSDEALFSCNCILNYVHGKLEGRSTGGVTGPITFGEIAHQLLNQTIVQLKIRNPA